MFESPFYSVAGYRLCHGHDENQAKGCSVRRVKKKTERLSYGKIGIGAPMERVSVARTATVKPQGWVEAAHEMGKPIPTG